MADEKTQTTLSDEWLAQIRKTVAGQHIFINLPPQQIAVAMVSSRDVLALVSEVERRRAQVKALCKYTDLIAGKGACLRVIDDEVNWLECSYCAEHIEYVYDFDNQARSKALACEDIPFPHDAECPVLALRALLAQMEGTGK